VLVDRFAVLNTVFWVTVFVDLGWDTLCFFVLEGSTRAHDDIGVERTPVWAKCMFVPTAQ
jgi:hypothetical protein